MAFIFKHGRLTTGRTLTRACARQPEAPKSLVKGVLNGLCNRTSCQEPGADWYNHATQTHYCGRCAAIINYHNHEDAQRLYGHALCIQVR
jgi:hypothetical protein